MSLAVRCFFATDSDDIVDILDLDFERFEVGWAGN